MSLSRVPDGPLLPCVQSGSPSHCPGPAFPNQDRYAPRPSSRPHPCPVPILRPCPPACCQIQGSPLPGGGGVSAPGAAGSAGPEVGSFRRGAPPRPWGRGLGSAPCSSAAAPVALRALRPCRPPRARVRCGQS